jgi:hypothetical protein
MGTRYFLALDGVKGDSLNSMYKGWFEVSNFDIDLTAAGGGASTAFSPLTLTLDSSRCWRSQRPASTSRARR